jgi:hypothetical protein
LTFSADQCSPFGPTFTTAEEITPFDLWHGLNRVDVALLVRHSKRDAAMRSLGVVVA